MVEGRRSCGVVLLRYNPESCPPTGEVSLGTVEALLNVKCTNSLWVKDRGASWSGETLKGGTSGRAAGGQQYLSLGYF